MRKQLIAFILVALAQTSIASGAGGAAAGREAESITSVPGLLDEITHELTFVMSTFKNMAHPGYIQLNKTRIKVGEVANILSYSPCAKYMKGYVGK